MKPDERRIWLLDVNRQHPSVILDGFDISLDQCPPGNWLPEKVSIQKLDILAPLPEDLIGKYNVVNVRLFACIIQNDDPIPILKNLMRMLSKLIYY